MPIITLLTDFGTEDEYVGLMKGVILSIHPAVSIVDITHQIDPQDIAQAAYAVSSSYRYFPEGTVHVVIVDPGVGSERRIIALQTGGHIFLAPDNGVLTLLFEDQTPDSLVKVDNTKFFRETICETFHGRDIFAPVGAYIAKGISLSDIGSEVDFSDVVRMPGLDCKISGRGEFVGKIISVDRFGNLITNIRVEELDRYLKTSGDAGEPQIRIRKTRIDGLVRTYSSAKPQKLLALIGSRGYLEIAINGSSAEARLKAKKGDTVKVIF